MTSVPVTSLADHVVDRPPFVAAAGATVPSDVTAVVGRVLLFLADLPHWSLLQALVATVVVVFVVVAADAVVFDVAVVVARLSSTFVVSAACMVQSQLGRITAAKSRPMIT